MSQVDSWLLGAMVGIVAVSIYIAWKERRTTKKFNSFIEAVLDIGDSDSSDSSSDGGGDD